MMNLSKLIKILLPLFATFSLIACSSGNNHDYHPDEPLSSTKEIQIPHNYEVTDKMEQEYPIPSIVLNKSGTKVSSLEPPTNVQ
jgi:hypothetical protein